MKKFFSNKNLVILIVCVLVALCLIVGTVGIRNNRERPTLIQRTVNDVVGYGDRVIAVPANGVGGFFGSIGNLVNTYQENNQLKSRVQSAKATDVRNSALQEENNSLKNQLNLNKSMTGYHKVNATVLSRTPTNWQQQLIINKGSKNGIKKNMSVMVNKGLVGRVSEVNGSNSKVELITDNSDSVSRFAVEVKGQKKPVNGLIDGYDNGKGQLEMGDLTAKDKIKKGATVMTNGLGGITPKGLYIGKVVGVSGMANGSSEQINIQPAADLDNIDVVTVISKD